MKSQGIIEGVVAYYLAQTSEPTVIVVGPGEVGPVGVAINDISFPRIDPVPFHLPRQPTVLLADPETVRHRGITMHEICADLIDPIPLYKPPLPVCPPKEYGQNRKRKNWKRK